MWMHRSGTHFQDPEKLSTYLPPIDQFSDFRVSNFTKLHRLHSFTFTDHHFFVAPILNFGPDLMTKPLPIASGLVPLNSGGLRMLSFSWYLICVTSQLCCSIQAANVNRPTTYAVLLNVVNASVAQKCFTGPGQISFVGFLVPISLTPCPSFKFFFFSANNMYKNTTA